MGRFSFDNGFGRKFLLMALVIVFLISSVSGIVFLTDKYDVVVSNRGDIHVNEYARYLERERNFLLEEYVKNGQLENLDYSFFDSDVFLDLTLQKMLNLKLLGFEVSFYNIRQKIELVVPKAVKEQTFFTNGKFDDLKFRQYLNEYGVTEKQFLDVLRQDDEAKFFVSLFTSVGYVEKIMTDALSQYNNVQRYITFFSKNKKDFIIGRGEYSPKEIEEFYSKNKYKFEIPESKKIDYLEFDDLSQKDAVLEMLLTSDNLKELAEQANKNIKSFGFITINNVLTETKHDLGKMFLFNKGELSSLEVVGDKMYVYAMADVKEKHFDTIENSRQKIIELLDESNRDDLIIKNANEIWENFKKNNNQNTLGINGFKSKSAKLLRNNNEYAEDFVNEVFDKKKGEVTNIFQDETKVYFAVVGNEVVLTNESEDFISTQTVFRNLSDSVMATIQNDYVKYLKNVKYNVKINRKMVTLLQRGY